MNNSIAKVEKTAKKLPRPHVKTKFSIENSYYKDRADTSPAFECARRGSLDIDLLRVCAVGCLTVFALAVMSLSDRLK